MRPDALFAGDGALEAGIGKKLAARAAALGIPVRPLRDADDGATRRSLCARVRMGRWLKPFIDACACGGNEYFLSAVEGCPHRCAYCFVSGYVEDDITTIFTNTGEMESELSDFLSSPESAGARVHAAHLGELVEWEEWTGLCASLCGLFSGFPETSLEIRTKSSRRIDEAWSSAPGNVVFSWTLTPEPFRARFEPGLPGPEARLDAAAAAAGLGARIALRLDPMLLLDGHEEAWARLAALAGARLSATPPQSIDVGTFRCSAKAAASIRAGPGREIMAGEVSRSEDGKYRYSWQARSKAYKRIVAHLRLAFGDAVPVGLSTEPRWMAKRVTG